ncbi:MAG: helix-hairpin-helix domain-containing protein [Saprospiraceae bacterium]
MTNKDIARYFNRLGKIMELHNENPFKIRSYTNAYMALRKIDSPLKDYPREELVAIRGIGKTIADKIEELHLTGALSTYQKYEKMTPPGIIEMLGIKGFGPKKIKTIWKQLEIETIGELLYACNENRLVELKGFGLKTQANLKKQLEYFVDSRGKYHFNNLYAEAEQLNKKLNNKFGNQSAVVGQMIRMMPEVTGIDILSSIADNVIIDSISDLSIDEESNKLLYQSYPVTIHTCTEKEFGKLSFIYNSSQIFIDSIGIEIPQGKDEKEIFSQLNMAFVHPEYRESELAVSQAKNDTLPNLITAQDIKGVVHNHSTYSDGLHSVADMAEQCIQLGYEYLVMSDHSKAAFYAGGLTEDQVYQQMEEIDNLNKKYNKFRIFKSIECDILNDGSMDYGNDFIQEFELVIASIHSNLKMDKQKATARLIKAIENPYTHILGHPTGRLLLAREGYPIDHAYIIDACAENNMIIELNANPQRLDLDWTWIPYALEKGVKISINPDAHSKDQIKYIHAGVCAARKGGLTKEMCLNAMGLDSFSKWIENL